MFGCLVKMCNVLENAILFNCRWTFTIVALWKREEPLTCTNLNKFQDRRTMIQQKNFKHNYYTISFAFSPEPQEQFQTNSACTQYFRRKVSNSSPRDKQSKPIHKLNIIWHTCQSSGWGVSLACSTRWLWSGLPKPKVLCHSRWGTKKISPSSKAIRTEPLNENL